MTKSDKMGGMYPHISVITPSYNQGEFLEETIRSVLNQGYPNLEYIIIDGGSSDNSVGIIRKYEGKLAYWVSESDDGQSDAINKGYGRATGEIICWLNSDDYFEPGTLLKVGKYFVDHPECDWIIGDCNVVDVTGNISMVHKAKYSCRESLMRFWEAWEGGTLIPQQSSFWRRKLIDGGLLNAGYHFALDYDLWLRLSNKVKPVVISATLANYRFHDDCKTVQLNDSFLSEQLHAARPWWRMEGIMFGLACERAWRIRQSEKSFHSAFEAKIQGERKQARKAIHHALICYPLHLFKWRYINLLIRLIFGR